MRRARACLLMVIGVLSLGLLGCDKIPYYYLGAFAAVGPNDEYLATAVTINRPTPLPAGTVQVSGQLSPAAFNPVPSILRFIIRHTDPGGAVVHTVTLNLAVQPNGLIVDQFVSTPSITVNPGDQLKFVFQPVGAILPVGRLKLKVLYEKS